MSNNIKVKEDPNYTDLGYDPFLNRSIQSLDPDYKTSEEWDLMTEDATIKSSKMGGDIIAKGIKFYDDSGNIIGQFDGSTGKISSSDGKTYFDLINNVFICNDGTNDRILIGLDTGGF